MPIDTDNSTIEDDVELDEDATRGDDDTPFDDVGGEDAFLTTLQGDEQSTQDPDGGTEADASDAADTSETDHAAEPEARDAPAPSGDDAIVEVKVGEETHRPTVGQLKRLFGQEAALTKRSQEVSQARTEATTAATHAKALITKAIERAEARFKPYAELDFWKLSRELEPNDFAQLRKDAAEARDELTYLQTEAASVDQNAKQLADANLRESAQACIKALTDKESPHRIEGWSQALYGELLTFAQEQGFTAASSVTDPAAIKLMRMAMLYERGRKLAQTKVTKVAAQPRRPLRPGSTGTPTAGARTASEADTRLRRTGRADDAEAAFMARLRDDSDD